MKLTIDMPAVSACEATNCAYNVVGTCNARAITVGNQVHAACDTFLFDAEHVGPRTESAGVGACKMSGCRHNRDFECEAPSIHVGMHADHADCLTFEAR